MAIKHVVLASPQKGDTLYTKDGIYILHVGSNGFGYYKGVGGEYVPIEKNQLVPKGPARTWKVSDKESPQDKPRALPKQDSQATHSFEVTVNYHGELHVTVVEAPGKKQATQKGIVKLIETKLKEGDKAQPSDYRKIRGYFNVNPSRVSVHQI